VADNSTVSPEGTPSTSVLGVALGLIGLAACFFALWAVQPFQFQVVTYRTLPADSGAYWPPLIFVAGVLVLVVGLAAFATGPLAPGGRVPAVIARGWPLLLSAPLAAYAFMDRVPPLVLTLLMILGVGLCAFRVGTSLDISRTTRRADRLAVGSILLLLVLLTVVHTRLQINFFEHFMLGHADFGHFTEELKNALVGRGLRSDSFDNTRLGWHFVPLLYVLVPGYALWSSPVYLMACGALFVHIVALPVYYFARSLSGSVAVAWMFGVAWLLLPSQSRLVYSNSYGFQWIYFAMPLLGIMIATGVTGRWRTCLITVGILLLCKETVAAATFGWGLYVLLFTPRRRVGAIIVLASLVYFVLCVKLFIPHFAAAGRYERMDLFGELGGTLWSVLGAAFTQPGLFWGRFVRPEVLYFLLMLLVPMALLPVYGWRMAIAALPTLLLVLLLQNEDWLSIKFWHQCTVLPLLFFAGVAAMGRAHTPRFLVWLSGRRPCSTKSLHRGMALSAVICAALGHYFYGFSPVSKSYEVYQAATVLHQPDPRMAIVQRLRSEIPKDRTVLATERLAPHFVDYKRIYTGGRPLPADFVIIDRSDRWDSSGLPQQTQQYADDPHYGLYGEYGSIIVFERAPDAPTVFLD